jgi:hypothetical protein
MSNLLLAKKFFTEVFGAICFYNDEQDGYTEFSDGRKLETLAVYFPNKLDLYIDETKSRLTKAAGENFYKRYCGADGKMVCGMASSKLLAAYYLNDVVVGIDSYMLGGLKGACNLIVDYFCGHDLKATPFGERCFTETVQTNNHLKIMKGEDIEKTLEGFLFTDNFSPYKKSQLFHLPKTQDEYVKDVWEMKRKIVNAFPDESKAISEIAKRRDDLFLQAFLKISREDYAEFEKDMGITSSNLKKDTE